VKDESKFIHPSVVGARHSVIDASNQREHASTGANNNKTSKSTESHERATLALEQGVGLKKSQPGGQSHA